MPLLFYFALFLVTLTIPLQFGADDAATNPNEAVQVAFLLSTVGVATALSSADVAGRDTLYWSSGAFLENYTWMLSTFALSTGLLSVAWTRDNEIRVTVLRSRRLSIFGRLISSETLVGGAYLAVVLGYFLSLRWPFLGNDLLGGGYPTYVPLGVFGRSIDSGILVGSLPTVQGVAFLVVFFLFVRELYDTEIALLGALLLAVNPLFNLLSFVPVTDMPASILYVSSLVLYLREKYTYSFLLCGLSVLVNHSFLLVSAPTIYLLLLLGGSDDGYVLLKFGFLTVVPLLLYRAVVVSATEPVAIGSLRTAAFVFALLLGVRTIERNDSRLADTIPDLEGYRTYGLLFLLPLVGLALVWSGVIALPSSLLVDPLSPFDALDGLWRRHLPGAVFVLFPLGLLWALFARRQEVRHVLVASCCSATFYTWVAPGSLLTHWYSRHVFVVVVIVGFLGLLDSVRRFDASRRVVMALATVFVILLVASSQTATVALLNEVGEPGATTAAVDDGGSELATIARPTGATASTSVSHGATSHRRRGSRWRALSEAVSGARRTHSVS